MPMTSGFNVEIKSPLMCLDGSWETEQFWERNRYIDAILDVRTVGNYKSHGLEALDVILVVRRQDANDKDDDRRTLEDKCDNLTAILLTTMMKIC